MARTNNIVIQGFSGKFGDALVFRQVGDKTIVAKAPKEYPPPTEAQQKRQTRFQQAMFYWKGVKNDPELLEAYKTATKPGQRACNIAVADFLNAPDIHEIDVTGYTGLPDQLIGIRVSDDFQVTAVNVSIQNEDGTLVEEGSAVPASNGQHWIYTTIAMNDSLTGDKITVTATDNPENLSSREISL